MQISKRKIDDKVWDSWWEKVEKLLFKKQNSQNLTMIFGMILSKSEKIMMAKRLMIGYLVSYEYDPYDIAREVKVSVATVYKHREFVWDHPEYMKLIKSVLPVPPKEKVSEGAVEKIMTAIVEGRRDRRQLNKLSEI